MDTSLDDKGDSFASASERPRFGPKEATREQRQGIVARAIAVNALANRKQSPFGEALNRRYIEGELSLAECSTELTRHYEQLYPTAKPENGEPTDK